MIEKVFEAKLDNLHTVLDFLDEQLNENGCSMKIATSLGIAMEELFVNVASYSYPSGSGDVTIKLDFVDKDIIIVLIDSGIPFDPVNKEDPDISLSAEERQIGGLGIYMVKKTMDEMKYDRINNQNVLTMKKRIKD